MELNREQIKKAIIELRNHGLANGGTLGYHAGWCDEVADTLENALALINSQEQKIKELTENSERLRAENAEQDAAIIKALKQMGEIRRETKTDAVRKVVDLIEEKALAVPMMHKPLKFILQITKDDLDQIAKEMTESAE